MAVDDISEIRKIGEKLALSCEFPLPSFVHLSLTHPEIGGYVAARRLATIGAAYASVPLLLDFVGKDNWDGPLSPDLKKQAMRHYLETTAEEFKKICELMTDSEILTPEIAIQFSTYMKTAASLLEDRLSIDDVIKDAQYLSSQNLPPKQGMSPELAPT